MGRTKKTTCESVHLPRGPLPTVRTGFVFSFVSMSATSRSVVLAFFIYILSLHSYLDFIKSDGSEHFKMRSVRPTINQIVTYCESKFKAPSVRFSHFSCQLNYDIFCSRRLIACLCTARFAAATVCKILFFTRGRSG